MKDLASPLAIWAAFSRLKERTTTVISSSPFMLAGTCELFSSTSTGFFLLDEPEDSSSESLNALASSRVAGSTPGRPGGSSPGKYSSSNPDR